MPEQYFLTSNIILYCEKWEETTDFYSNRLGLPITFSCDWFMEFRLTDTSRMSIADEKKSRIKSPQKKGITVALQVRDIDAVRRSFSRKALKPTQIRDHPWNAKVFYLFDPEGHRIEIWQQNS